jgi:acetyl-CoA carboxylase carboxyl transferase subunit alpha
MDLLELRLIDKVLAEPAPGAHHSITETVIRIDTALSESLQAIDSMSPEERIARRYRRLREYGAII